jgi:hypothetical protein
MASSIAGEASPSMALHRRGQGDRLQGLRQHVTKLGRLAPNRVGVAPGIDVRGDGSYVVVAPSERVRLCLGIDCSVGDDARPCTCEVQRAFANPLRF